jgi:hypothetical protein
MSMVDARAMIIGRLQRLKILNGTTVRDDIREVSHPNLDRSCLLLDHRQRTC